MGTIVRGGQFPDLEKESFMKKLVLAVILASSATCAMADDHWEYTEKLPSGDICYYLESNQTGKPILALGNAAPDSLYEECENNGSYERAKKDLANLNAFMSNITGENGGKFYQRSDLCNRAKNI